jgi:excinuclease ABC subunit C
MADISDTQSHGSGFDTGAEVINKKLQYMPSTPGVYRMLDETGKVLYVGKAKNLKRRVSNYTKWDRLSDRIRMMVSRTKDLIVVTTKTESEAFLLENELIKNLHPYFNILLKDDKTFPHIVITKDDFPRIMKHRGMGLKGDYFGPFTDVESVLTAIKSMEKAFLIRSCKDSVFNNRSRPCMLYQIKQCSAPCCDMISRAEYMEKVQEAKDFLNGKTDEVQDKLLKQMQDFSDSLQYEKAAEVRDRIKALNKIQSQKGTGITSAVKTDVIAIYKEEHAAAVEVFFIRGGLSFGNKAFFYFNLQPETTESEILENFIGQFYNDFIPPAEIVISHKIDSAEAIEEALSCHLNFNPIGARKALLQDALLNAKGALERKKAEKATDDNVYAKLAELVGLTTDELQKIEVYDNSHIQGTNAVGVMIAADSNGFKKNSYRRFNIRAEDYTAGDDFAMMREVLGRRLKSGKKENNLPSLIIMDGGRGQIKSALWAMYKEDLTTNDIKIIGIAKGEKHDGGNETLFIPLTDGKYKSVRLGPSSPLLFYIERLRDEAHRFAIGTHRAKRSKSMFANPLDEIEGVGAKRKKQLLERFGSVKALQSASAVEIAEIKGISEDLAQTIYNALHNK